MGTVINTQIQGIFTQSISPQDVAKKIDTAIRQES
jgi:hypothetical protein